MKRKAETPLENEIIKKVKVTHIVDTDTLMADSTQQNADLFDEDKATNLMDLYSRQIGTYGVETMKNLSKLRILIIGAKGVGIETAKNLILAGPGAVTIHDDNPVTIADLGTNFYLTEGLVGSSNRAEACINQLKQLNPYVNVSSHSGELTDDFIKTFGAVVVTDDTPLEKLKHISKLAHNNQITNASGSVSSPILFLIAVTNGVTATLFADFGPSHVVTDETGEPARINSVDNIVVSKDENGTPYLVVTTTAAKHGFDEDAKITFGEVEGMTQLNDAGELKIVRLYKKMLDKDQKERQVLILNKFRVDHPDIAKWSDYKSGGAITEVKPSKTFSFVPLEEGLIKPITEYDMFMVKHPHQEKMYGGSGAQLHFARLALWAFQAKHGKIPKLHCTKDADEVVALAKEILEKHKTVEGALTVEEIKEDYVRKASLYASTELPGITAFLGGIAAQEVVKKFGKYTPLCQWMHTDYFELLNDSVPADAEPKGTRYDHQIAIFGKSYQEKLEKQKWFMVGCGALGCEYLKGLSLMGLGSNGGVLYVTDMDTIEISNLSRQFLFRRDNVGQFKSSCAAAAARVMNPHMNIVSFEVPVGPDTENKFDDSFWSGLDGVCNALDNIKAREYTDSKCVFFEKPLLESGTLGTKANSELVIPHKTPSYSQQRTNEEEEAIPMCTLRNFPHLIEHCIEWARAQFSDVFADPPASFNNLKKDKNGFFGDLDKQADAEALDVLENVYKLSHNVSNGANFESCLRLAFDLFLSQFRDRIQNLIYAFPEDSTKEDQDTKEKIPFWSGAKRFPRAVEFNLDDELQLQFLYNATNLYAVMFQIPPVRDIQEFKRQATNANLKPPEWKPSKSFLQKVQSEVKQEQSGEAQTAPTPSLSDDEERIKELKEKLKNTDVNNLPVLEKAEFEKDDDTNFHIDFITSCANMRAWNYHIKIASRHKCKMIAGRIIPAVATTTAMITGLVEMELYKYLKGVEIQHMCNSNVNLGISSYELFEPIGPIKAKEEYDVFEMENVVPVPEGWTIWDKVIVDKGDLTVEEFVKVFPSVHHDVKVKGLYFKDQTKDTTDKPIWLSFPFVDWQKKLVATNTPKKLTEIYKDTFGELPARRNYILLVGSFETKDGNICSVPPVKFVFPTQ